MIHDSRLIIVGGTSRNVGKTEFSCNLIEKLVKDHDVYGLKVSTISPDILKGGSKATFLDSSYQLNEEKKRETKKDTSRMLRAGAKGVYYLQSDGAGLKEGFEEFQKLIPKNAVVVCESNSLDQCVKPELLVVVRTIDGHITKKAEKRLTKADLVVISDGVSGFPELEKINLSNPIYIS